MRIALGFWGITRSLTHTIPSIQEKILTPLRLQNVELTIFMHTFSVNSKYNNTRTNELNIQLNNNEYHLLNPDYIKIDDQDDVKSKINIENYRSQPDPWNTNYNSVDNFICAMYSKNELVKMIQESNEEFDYIIFLRPDVRYLHPLNLKYLNHVTDNKICIPHFCMFYNFNDRFAITNMNSYKIYGTLFNELLEYSKTNQLHSEKYQSHLLHQKKIKFILIPFYFNRVRFNGYELKDDTVNEYKTIVRINKPPPQNDQNIILSIQKIITNHRNPSMKMTII
jgi:hypothetical protein